MPTEREATADREIVVSRAIAGPPDVVFAAYTQVRHLSRWWGPNGFSTTTHSFDFRLGGIWDFTMHGPDGTDYPNWIEYLEISPPERIVFRHGDSADDPKAHISTVTIAQRGDSSEVTLRSVFPTKAQRDEVVERYHAIEGAEQTLAALTAYVESKLKSDDGKEQPR
ncbi:MAG TPA: SRPBCC family protein [Acidimicrobiia bacterium]|nr:SRPBCC family protein [Acidimicrobiia bacterium]